jgi:hypothetical protein
VLRKVLLDVATTYRLDAFENYWDDECGSSVSPYNATVVPLYKKSTTLRVKRVVNPGSIAESAAATKESGWADDSDDGTLNRGACRDH